SAPASITAAEPTGSAASPCRSMCRQAGASSCVRREGRTSTSETRLSAFALVARRERGDQAVDALGVDLLRELAAVGVDQPDAEHVEVVDLPAAALAGGLLEPVVDLHRIAATATDLGAHQHLLVVGRAP